MCESLDKLRIDLLTITDCAGMQNEEEERFDPNLFPDTNVPRCKKFKNKRVSFYSFSLTPKFCFICSFSCFYSDREFNLMTI